jgi:hypothetical protein
MLATPQRGGARRRQANCRREGDAAVAFLRRLARARLASQVIRRLRRAGVGGARYDARTFSVRFTPEGHEVPTIMELGGLLADRSGGRRGRRARTERFVAGFLRAPGLPTDGDSARPLLRPVLRGVTPMPADITAPLRRAVFPFLSEYVVVDQPDTMTYVSADQLPDWGMTADEVFAAARANLSGAVLQSVASEATVVQFVDDGDAYWTSHLLLDGWLARLADQVGGVPVAFAPERGTLIVVADGSAHLPGMFAQVERAYIASPSAISPMAYVSDEHGHTVPYAAPPGHPMHECVQRAEAVLAVTEYARQAMPPADNPAELRLVSPEQPRRPRLHDSGPGSSQLDGPEPEDPGSRGTQPEPEGTDPEGPKSHVLEPAGPKDHAPENDGPKDHGPKDHGPEDPGPKPESPELERMHPDRAEPAGWRTRAIWPRNEPVLLPRADEVLVGATITPWRQLEPHLTRVPGVDPPRWRATAWPDDVEG